MGTVTLIPGCGIERSEIAGALGKYTGLTGDIDFRREGVLANTMPSSAAPTFSAPRDRFQKARGEIGRILSGRAPRDDRAGQRHRAFSRTRDRTRRRRHNLARAIRPNAYPTSL